MPDPMGESPAASAAPGIEVAKMRVPLGVFGIIYESAPT